MGMEDRSDHPAAPVTTRLIGTAGWAIPRATAPAFAAEGSALQRYATRLRAVEINSSFHRPHRRATWERWAKSVPEDFRFAVKIPRTISHDRRLIDCADPLARFLAEVEGLGEKLAVLLLQLPPGFAFAAKTAGAFFGTIAHASAAALVCEPRHPSWFEEAPDDLMRRMHVARVAADPAPVPAAAFPGGWSGLSYRRLHGSPHMYRSSYGDDSLRMIADALLAGAPDRPDWCMFDNTASGAATCDALRLCSLVDAESGPR